VTTELETLVRRPELDEYKQAAVDKAKAGICEGNCEKHTGQVVCVRVYDKKHGNDWGWYSYCEEAIDEDTRSGFALIDA
jgi:hypothetical protein